MDEVSALRVAPVTAQSGSTSPPPALRVMDPTRYSAPERRCPAAPRSVGRRGRKPHPLWMTAGVPSALAGQLVAEGGQGFVGGQGAGRGVVVLAGRAVAAARAAGRRLGGRGGVARLALFLGLGAGLLDLAAVCLEAG